MTIPKRLGWKVAYLLALSALAFMPTSDYHIAEEQYLLVYALTFPTCLTWTALGQFVQMTNPGVPELVVKLGYILSGYLQWFVLLPELQWRFRANQHINKVLYLGFHSLVLIWWFVQTFLFQADPMGNQHMVLWSLICFPWANFVPFGFQIWLANNIPVAGALLFASGAAAIGYLQWFILFPKFRTYLKTACARVEGWRQRPHDTP